MRKDILSAVRHHLTNDVGNLRKVSDETAIPYDTILRIKNGEGDPGYSKVQALFDYYAATSKPAKPNTADAQHAANVRAATKPAKKLDLSQAAKQKRAA